MTTRTLQSDIDAINEFARPSGVFISTERAGEAVLKVEDPGRAAEFMHQTTLEIQETFAYTNEQARAQRIIETLLLSRKRVKLETLTKALFISPARLTQDLKNVRAILAWYDLKLDQVKGEGVRIVGDSLDKRACLMKESTIVLIDNVSYIDSHKFSHMIDQATEVTISVLAKYNTDVPDIALQNIVTHVAATLEMLLRGDYVEPGTVDPSTISSHDRAIAAEILHRFGKRFSMEIPEQEIDVLAGFIQGKREYGTDDLITEEIDNLVMRGLVRVKQVYGIDLTDNIDLRVALALHLAPLRRRLETDSQIPNALTMMIKQNYSLAFELSNTFLAGALTKKAPLATEDELSFLACHFAAALERSGDEHESLKRVLIVSGKRKSNTLLLENQVRAQFPEVTRVESRHSYDTDRRLAEDFDCVLVTEKDFVPLYEDSIYLPDPRIDDEMRFRIQLALSGFRPKRDFLPLFDQRLFFTQPCAGKHEAIEFLFSRVEEAGLVSHDVLDEVMYHEDNASSYFGEGLAIAHSETMVQGCGRSIFAVLVADEPFAWDRHKVSLAMLLLIGSEDPQRYRIWNYISHIISNPDTIIALKQCRSFKTFVSTIESCFSMTLGAK